jgi:opacity protein-like surface antigen
VPACRLRTIALAGLASWLATGPCAAQSPPGGAPAAFKRFDATGYLAWYRGQRDHTDFGVSRDDWYSAPLGAVSVGRYWTEHLKTEIEVSATGRGRTASGEFERLGPDLSRSILREHLYTVRTVSLVASYQFLHNAWVHPFAGAGLDLDWERRRTTSQVQIFSTSVSPPPGAGVEPPVTEDVTELVPRVALVAGFKAYMSRHAFFRTDVRASVARGVDQVSWRFGLGLDF